METIHTPDHVPDEPGVYRLVDDADKVAAIVTVPDTVLDMEEIGDVSVDLIGRPVDPPVAAQRADIYPDADLVKRMPTNSRRTTRRLTRILDRGYSIVRIYHVPGQRRATWSFVKVSR